MAKMPTIRAILNIVVSRKLFMSLFDVFTVFLRGKLEKTVYIKQPSVLDDNSGLVCRLVRSLYGLKRSSRCWNKCIGTFLTDHGFRQSDEDPCLYIYLR